MSTALQQPLEERVDAFKLSTPQKGLWAATLSNPTSSACVTGQYSDIHGPVSVATFELASRHVIAETEALRLRFGGPVEEPCSGFRRSRRGRRLLSICRPKAIRTPPRCLG